MSRPLVVAPTVSPSPGRPTGVGRPAPVAWSERCSRSCRRATAPGSGGPETPAARPNPSPSKASSSTRSPSPKTRSLRYYEGFSNDTLWPLYHDAIRESGYQSDDWDSLHGGQRALRRAARQHRATGRAGLDPRLPPATRAGDAPLAARRRAHRLVQPHPVPAARTVPAAPLARRDRRRACSDADVLGFQRDRVRSTSSPPARNSCSAPNDVERRPSSSTTVTHHGRRCVPDLDRRRGLRAAGQRAVGATPATSEIRTRLGRARGRSCSASTGSTTPRASAAGCRAFGAAARSTAELDPDATCSSRSRLRPRSGSSVYQEERRRDRADSSARSTAVHARLGLPGDPLPVPDAPARPAGRAVPRGRCDAGDTVPRRDEPGRQGVRRRPTSTATACSCCPSSPARPTS